MCVAVPAQIKSVRGFEAEVDAGGTRRVISLWLTPEARVGDYVYVHTGFSISILDEAEALESLHLLEELLNTHSENEMFRTAGGSDG